MSHGVYKSIKQIEPGVFRISVTDNNVYSIVNGRHVRDFREYDNDYFKRECPIYNKQQAEAAMLIAGCYSGDEYYPQSWKQKQQLAFDYLKLVERKYRTDFLKRHNLSDDSLSNYYQIHDFNETAKENRTEIYDSFSDTYDIRNPVLVNGLIKYLEEHRDEAKKKPCYISFNGLYVCRLNKHGFNYSSSKKLLNLTKQQIEKIKRVMEQNEITDYQIIPA